MKFKNLISATLAAKLAVFSFTASTGCKAPEGKAVAQNQVIERVGSLPATAKILFVSNRDTKKRSHEIYAMDLDGSNVTRLTFTEEHHFITGIDRSRRYIVASRAVEDTRRPRGLGNEDRKSLWVIDLEKKKETRLTDLRYHAEGDSFSPDSQWIVFSMRLGDKDPLDIYKIRRDGSELTNLTNSSKASEGDPVWSNDGTKIVFAYLDAKIKRFILKSMDTDGGNIKTIYDGGEGVATPVFPPGNYDPSWSPDDRWIVFGRAVKFSKENWGSGIWHIFKVRNDGTDLIDLSLAGGHTEWAEYLPSFSPDGKNIIFGSIYNAKNPFKSHNDIFMMEAGNGSVKRLTKHRGNDMYPVWIPVR